MAINWAPQIRNTTNSIPNPPEKSKFDRKSLNVASFHLADSRWAKPLAFILTDTERIEKNVSDFKKKRIRKTPIQKPLLAGIGGFGPKSFVKGLGGEIFQKTQPEI